MTGHPISCFTTRWWVAVEPSEHILVEGAKRAEEVEIYSVGGTALSLSLKSGVIDTAITTRSWGLGIRTIQEGRIGFSSTSDPMRWQECLEAAIASGKVATSQEWKGLPQSENLHVRALRADPAVSPDLEIATTLGALVGAALTARVSTAAIAVIFGLVLIYSAYLSNRLSPESPPAQA